MTQNLLACARFLTGWTVIYCDTKKPGGLSSVGKFSLANVWFTLIAWLRYLRLLPHADLVHLPLAQNTTGFLRDSVFLITAKVLRRRIILHFHGGSFDQFYAASSPALRGFIRSILAKADRLLVLGDRIGWQFDALVDSKRIRCLPNGIDAPMQPAARAPNDDINVLFLGKISVAKGALDFVQAAKILLRGPLRDRLKFRLVGSYVEIERNISFIDEPHGVKQRLATLLNEANCECAVTVHPEVVGEAKWEEYRGADIFVAPSYSEGLPLTILEAMATGLPVIATDVGAIPDVLAGEQSRFIVPVGIPVVLAERIAELAAEAKLRERLGIENRRLIQQEYSLESFARRLRDIYDDIRTRSKPELAKAG